MRLELSLAPPTEKRLDTAALAMHHAVHQGAREIGVGLVILGLCIFAAAIVLAGEGE